MPERVTRTVAAVRDERLTYLKPAMLRRPRRRVLELERDGVAGLVVEAGAARGGSAIVLAAAKSPERPMKVYDVFGMIPPPTEHDGADVHRRYATITAGEAKGPGRRDVLRLPRRPLPGGRATPSPAMACPSASTTSSSCAGLFEDTIQLDEPVAFAHLDGDWYESTMTCLTRIAPLLATGGRIVLDDYYKWSGLPEGGRRVLRRPRGLPARAPDEAPRRP